LSIVSIALAFLAGLLSCLSPCVLPLLPIVFGAAIAQHRFGPAALAAGVAISFFAIGLFVAAIGYGLGLDSHLFRSTGAILMILVGGVLLLPALQLRLSAIGTPFSNWIDQRFRGSSTRGLRSQFGLGLLLGAVWVPCVGPTLGAASVLAAEGKALPEVGLTMLAFGFGAALPLVLLGHLSREVLMRWRARLGATGKGARTALGFVLVALGCLTLGGWDKRLETALVNASPRWLTELTTRF
jgi:cytochrome c biogenesis protein CcdA